MKIIKYKKCKGGVYKIELDDGRSISLYEEVILKYRLLINKEINDNDMDSINKYNLKCDAYYTALNNIKSRFKSEYQLRGVLHNKGYSDSDIDFSIDKLISQGYLNDRLFARSYINTQMLTTSRGPLRIERDLIDKGVDGNIINDEIVIFNDEEEINRIKKIVDKKIKSNRNRGGSVLKNKIYNDIKILGYNSYNISKVLNEYSFTNNYEIARREYDKLYRKYSRKYSGYELENKIKDGLYKKGLTYNE